MAQSPADPDQLLEAIIGRLQGQAVPPMPESLIDPAADPFGPEKTVRFSQTLTSWVGRRRVQVSASVLAVAAVVFFLAVGPFGQRASFAFGDVQKAIEATTSLTYQCSMTNGNDEPIVVQVALLGGDRTRADFSDGDIQIVNRKEDKAMTVSRAKRTAVIQALSPSPEFSKIMTDWFLRFRTLPEEASRRIGDMTYQDRKAVDFVVKLDERDYTVTVDSETKLPLRMEFATNSLPSTGRPYRELYTDFVFDAPLEASLFAMVPPVGYTLEGLWLPKSAAPADRALVISPETGIGPVRFGMTQEEIVKLLGKPDQSTTSEATMPVQGPTGLFSKPQTYTSTTMNYDSRGFELDVQSGFKISASGHPGYGLIGIRVFNEAGRLPTVRNFQGMTREGIRLGAAPEDVLAVYGKPDGAETTNGAAVREALTYRKLGWIFEFRDGTLAAIKVNPRRPADELPGKAVAKQAPAAQKPSQPPK